MDNIMLTVADLMSLAARTAPKTRGQDCIKSIVISGDKKNFLADEMVRYGRENNKKVFIINAEEVRNSDAVLLIAVSDNKRAGLNCGACGKDNCDDLVTNESDEYAGPICAWRLIDIGIAIGSAVKTASIMNADNRIMYTAGLVALRIGFIEGPMVIGIPISAYGKNIYFDRQLNK